MDEQEARAICEVVQGAAVTLAELVIDDRDFRFILTHRFELLKSVVQGIEALELALQEARGSPS